MAVRDWDLSKSASVGGVHICTSTAVGHLEKDSSLVVRRTLGTARAVVIKRLMHHWEEHLCGADMVVGSLPKTYSSTVGSGESILHPASVLQLF